MHDEKRMQKMIRKTLVFMICLLAAFQLPAADDSERFRQIHEKEWSFRMSEFPMFASSVGMDDYADRMADVSEEAEARRYRYWKEIRAELDEVSCQRLNRT